jgi:hypothetical protein
VADGVLYFPYISVPQNAWFTRVLLYWDQVGSIVPEPHARDLSRVSPYMRDLVRAGLVRPVVPEAYDSRLGRALGPFLDFVDSDPEITARARAGFGAETAKRGGSEPGTTMHIHRGKFGYIIGAELQQRGLARPAGDGRRRRDWLEVESRTAAAFMAHLAATLGSFDDVDLDPITDTISSLSPFAPAEAAPDPLAVAAELRLSVLEAVLPGPTREIQISTLVDFKERHGELLGRFRRHIESRLLDLGTIDDPEVRGVRHGILTEELEDELAEVQSRMRPRWPRLVFGTLCSLVGAAIPVGAALAVGAVPLAAAGLPGLVGAVYSTQQAVRSPDEMRRHPLAYAALAQRQLTV